MCCACKHAVCSTSNVTDIDKFKRRKGKSIHAVLVPPHL